MAEMNEKPETLKKPGMTPIFVLERKVVPWWVNEVGSAEQEGNVSSAPPQA